MDKEYLERLIARGDRAPFLTNERGEVCWIYMVGHNTCVGEPVIGWMNSDEGKAMFRESVRAYGRRMGY